MTRLVGPIRPVPKVLSFPALRAGKDVSPNFCNTSIVKARKEVSAAGQAGGIQHLFNVSAIPRTAGFVAFYLLACLAPLSAAQATEPDGCLLTREDMACLFPWEGAGGTRGGLPDFPAEGAVQRVESMAAFFQGYQEASQGQEQAAIDSFESFLKAGEQPRGSWVRLLCCCEKREQDVPARHPLYQASAHYHLCLLYQQACLPWEGDRKSSWRASTWEEAADYLASAKTHLQQCTTLITGLQKAGSGGKAYLKVAMRLGTLRAGLSLADTGHQVEKTLATLDQPAEQQPFLASRQKAALTRDYRVENRSVGPCRRRM